MVGDGELLKMTSVTRQSIEMLIDIESMISVSLHHPVESHDLDTLDNAVQL